MKACSAVSALLFPTIASARLNELERERDFAVPVPVPPPSCTCSSDDDCHPRCVFKPYSKVGHCTGDFIPPSPTPPMTAPPSSESCCEKIRTVPTKCEVDTLVELLDVAVSSALNLAGQWLRLSFHDAGTFHQKFSEGGANGCLMNFPPMRLEPENAFLDVPINTLEAVRNSWEGHPSTCVDVSSADMIQFAGFFVAVRQMGVPGLNKSKREKLRDDFHWGRPDEEKCQTKWTSNLPGFELGTNPGNIPLRCANAGGEIRDKMMDRNGFSATEATALIGAHTIGKTRNTFPGLAGPWVTNGEDGATPDGPVFDNSFHDFLINGIIANNAAAFAANPPPSTAPFTSLFPTWFRDDRNGLNHLDTDVALAFPPVPPAQHPDFRPISEVFAKDNDRFLSEFFAALDKMGKLGVNVKLHPASEPCPPPCGGGITLDDVREVVRDLGVAAAVGGAALEDQKEKLIDVSRERTTPVGGVGTSDP